MKVPKTFIPKKDLNKETERLLKESDEDLYDSGKINLLLENCEIFLKEQEGLTYFNDLYTLAAEIAKDINYTQKDLERLVKEVKVNSQRDLYLGYYFSAFANKIIKEKDVITLDINAINANFPGLGAFLEKGTLKIIGNTGLSTGYTMKGGLLIVEGDTWFNTGVYMTGGEIRVYGSIMGSVHDSCKGTVYQNDEKVWPK